MRRPGLLVLLLASVLSAPARADVRPFTGAYPPELPEAKAYVYKTVGDVELKLWVYRPESQAAEPRAAIVFFFGGGWNSGTPQQFENQCLALARRGMVAITVDYRVANRQGVTPFECAADAKSAIRWVRAHASELGIDPQKIVASGGSAGGHVACCTAVIPGLDDPADDRSVSSVPNALALFNPAVMLANFCEFELLDAAKAKNLSERMQGRASEISPIEYVREGLPPTIIFHGTADEAVPFATVELFAKRMRFVGNRCELMAYPDEPHGFFNPRLRDPRRKEAELRNYRSTLAELDAFLVSLGYLPEDRSVVTTGPGYVALGENIVLRGSLHNSRLKFSTGKKAGHVAFLGGSITEMNGYRPMVMEFLKQRFPETLFEFTPAGIASTCSTTGAFRLERDVLSAGRTDLLFVEFAVNDDQDAFHTREESIRGMEGIIRQLRAYNPHADIVMIYFVNPEMLAALQAGQIPLPIAAHAAVARHYGIPTIHLAREVAQRIERRELTWEQFGGTHPAPTGNRICADMIERLLNYAWEEVESPASPREHALPKSALDPFHYGEARFVDLETTTDVKGWQISVPEWDALPGSKRDRFTQQRMFWSETPGATFTLKLEGSTAIAYVSAGPDAGMLEVSVDGGPPRTVDLYHRFSKGLHYPRSVVLATDLPPGAHSIRVTLSSRHNPESSGTAARIMELGVD